MNKFFSKIVGKLLGKTTNLYKRAVEKITKRSNKEPNVSQEQESDGIPEQESSGMDIDRFHEEIQTEIAENRKRMDRERKRNLRERLERSAYSDYETSFDNIVPPNEVIEGAKYRDAVDRINRARARRDPTGAIEKKISVPPGKEKEFFDFLHSSVLKNLRGYIDSDLVVDYVTGRLKESDLDEIMLDIEDFLTGELDDEEFMREMLLAYD